MEFLYLAGIAVFAASSFGLIAGCSLLGGGV
ncbi:MULTISPECIES: potassium ABC transporter ATPase [unclassified Undibacterium]|nr:MULTISPECIES: potassium ABC transporter ATPase [unclassified Undibacterium]MEB0139913.1 potassium ABC transporter ATPase [Undibacterium sp. CCC2.1]MEB0171818.1 potassium ABC transporter ATPase [Undibacterium sp. CCC1.1]MEB0175634.1 potassium ABC transporter ATPase [Undibacterium sp. CCC3.4]MEB0216216.1 potassium ABC transporter ATPase [Undibacterium sp. 5I2]WPX44109.1 potassium ABC transporter ATPase [Undibacterium sp. CCC3.4]